MISTNGIGINKSAMHPSSVDAHRGLSCTYIWRANSGNLPCPSASSFEYDWHNSPSTEHTPRDRVRRECRRTDQYICVDHIVEQRQEQPLHPEAQRKPTHHWRPEANAWEARPREPKERKRENGRACAGDLQAVLGRYGVRVELIHISVIFRRPIVDIL